MSAQIFIPRNILLGTLLLLAAGKGFTQTNSLEGLVKDESGRPVHGATVHILDSDVYTGTDSSGRFYIRQLPRSTGILSLSAVGYAAITVPFSGTDAAITIVMKNSAVELDEALVTAEKRETDIQRLPISVTTFNAGDIAGFRLWNARDLTALAPNLFAADPGDKRNVVSVRGITTTSYDPAVTTYVDGVCLLGLDTYIAQLFDVERIEVVRGPQGSLYGRNTMGGIINITTHAPSNTRKGFVEVSAGEYGLQQYSAGIQVPLIRDRLFFKGAGQYQRSDGYYTNDFNNSHYDRQNAFSGSFSLEYRPTGRWRFSLDTKQQLNRNHGAFPLTMGVDDAMNNPYHLNQDALTVMRDNTWNISLSARYSGAGFQVSSQTAYQRNYRYYEDPIDADFSPIDGISILNNYGKDWNHVKAYTQEFRIHSVNAPGSKWQWTGGAFLFLQDNPVKQATHFGEEGDLAGGGGNNYSLISSSTGKNRGLAFYGQASYRLLPRWELTAGIRYDAERRSLSILGEYQEDTDPAPAFAFRSDTSAALRFHALSPRLTLSYEPGRYQLLFASYSMGFRTGGLTSLSADPAQPALYPYLPEHSQNFEAGWKWRHPGNRAQFNLTAFHTIVSDVQVPTLVLPEAITITRNTGRMVSTGLEAELLAKLLPGFDIRYSLGYVRARYKELKIASGGDEADLGGKRQIFTPDISSMLGLQYRYPLHARGHWALTIGGGWKYLGTQYFDLANSIRQSPYHLLNLSAGIEKANISLTGWMQNVTNTRYIGYAYDFGAVNLAEPRRLSFTLGIRL